MAALKCLVISLAAGLSLAPLAAFAQYKGSGPSTSSFRCVGKDGRKYYASTIPPECIGRPVEQLNNRGLVIKRIDPAGDEKARQESEAAAAKKREEEAVARENQRRNRALLATYTSVKDIDDARLRALGDNERQVKDVENRIAGIKKRQEGYVKELEFYKGKNKPPAKLADDIQNAEVDLKAQENLLAAKRKEVDTINAKYDEDRRRYLELRGGK